MDAGVSGSNETGDRTWRVVVASIASLAVFLPLTVAGTPDVESYVMSIFSTMKFARNLAAGVDPWFAADYGFGITLPSSSWLIRFPLAVPAAWIGLRALYAVIWIGGGFFFSIFFLRLVSIVTPRRSLAVVLLATALLSFSNLGTTYVDDWPEHYLGWACLPAALWCVVRVFMSESGRSRLAAGAACVAAMGLLAGSGHQNDMVTFFSGMGITVLLFLMRRPAAVAVVGLASLVALASVADIIVPTLQGMSAGGTNPLGQPIQVLQDDLSLSSYRVFLAPLPALMDGGWHAITASSYDRVPFFGLVILILAGAGALLPFVRRESIGSLPIDLARMFGAGFLVFSILTVLPSWVMLHLPRMWMYRDGQTVLALVCAAITLDFLMSRASRLVRPLLLMHAAQVVTVAAPIILNVFSSVNDGRLFAYASRPHVLFDGLRQSGVSERSRVAVAGSLEEDIRGRLGAAGLTAGTDFSLEGINLVNAWYRGGHTPALGQATITGRYRAYETVVSWRGSLQELAPATASVLGITHIVAFDADADALGLPSTFGPGRVINLPGERAVRVMANPDAWSRAVLVPGSGPVGLASRTDCRQPTIACADFSALARVAVVRLEDERHGSSFTVPLPAGHSGGRVLVSISAGAEPRAWVDGTRRPVSLLLDTFPIVEVQRGDREVKLSVSRSSQAWLTICGLSIVVLALVVALLTDRGAVRGRLYRLNSSFGDRS